MTPTEQRVSEAGARLQRTRAELKAAEDALRALMPAARAELSQERIRALTGLSIPTIRRYHIGI